MSNPHQGKVAIVTGAARGIGRACALKLAQQGAHLVLNDLAPSEELTSLGAAIEAHGRMVLLYPADISDDASVEAMFLRMDQTFGRVDMLINNAAWNVRKPFLDQSLEEAQQTLNTTFWAAFHCTQQAARRMTANTSGSIVMISSVHAARPYPNASVYNASKAALNHLAASIALELAPSNIRVNIVEPGWIDTPGERLHNTEAQIESRSHALPMARLGSAEEIAEAVAYLCSDAASYITGSTLRVDGGFSLKF